MPGTAGERVYLIRLALGDGVKNPMRIDDFVVLVERLTGVSYDPSAISRTENGSRKLTLDDVSALALVDPSHRGKLWLAWGESEDATLRIPRPPVLERLKAEPEPVAKPALTKKAARKSGRSK